MKTFTQWLEENKISLPSIEGEGEKANISEKTKRAGISDNYPKGYAGRDYAYPPSYWTPISANAPGKLAGKMGS